MQSRFLPLPGGGNFPFALPGRIGTMMRLNAQTPVAQELVLGCLEFRNNSRHSQDIITDSVICSSRCGIESSLTPLGLEAVNEV